MMRRPLSLAAIAFPLACLLLPPADASAYVRRTTDKGHPVYWPGSCAWVTPDTDVPPELTLDVALAAVNRAVSNWQSATSACSYVKITVDPPASGEARYDGKNVVKFRRDEWCRPAEPKYPQMCFSPDVASITTTLYAPDTGEILDADIELNSVNFTFLIEPTNARPRTGTIGVDLEATLTHEMGHFLGLDHTCWDHVAATPPVDDQGHPTPDCKTLQTLPADERSKVISSSMYPFPTPGDTGERTVKPDDVAGICAIYPLAADPHRCERASIPGSDSSSGGCAVTRNAALGVAGERSAGSTWWLLALAVSAAWRRALRRTSR